MSSIVSCDAPVALPIAICDRNNMRRSASDMTEDLATERLVDRALAAIARGQELVLPAEVSDRISAGENPIRVLREWREIGQAELAVAAGTTQSDISDLETGRKRGHPQLHRKIADYLKVPLDLLVP